MAYRQGSMGMAILAGFLVFFGVNALCGLVLAPNLMGALSGVVGGAFAGLFMCATGVCVINAVGLILAIIVPIVAGIIAGVVARGSAGRGFVAGLSGTIIGYYVGLMVLVLYIIVQPGGSQLLGMMLSFNGPMAIYTISTIFLSPMMAGVIGGIGGAIMSALLASPAMGASPATTTTFVQAPPISPIIIGGGYQQPQQAPSVKVICPACKTQNDSASTFCQSCGTRLKS